MIEHTVMVLIADDDDLDRSLTERAVNQAMPLATIVCCADGAGCLEQLRCAEAGLDITPSLVFLDFKMPRLGCMDILREFRRPDFLAEVPFVLFSSSVGPIDVQTAQLAGMREYVEKPTDPDEYADRVHEICVRYLGVAAPRAEMR